MSISGRNIMENNRRLISRIFNSVYGDANKTWKRIIAEFCKRHAQLTTAHVMQFKYEGTHYHMDEDVPLRGGVKNLHPNLVEEFKEPYKMFVIEVKEEQRLLTNMLADAIRYAKYTEDLLDLLPEFMHEAITDVGFFQLDSKPEMSIDNKRTFLDAHAQYFALFETRTLLGKLS